MSSSNKMRAVRVHKYGGPEELKLDTGLPIPQPGNNEVLIKVHAIGVNPVETYIRAGGLPSPPLPYIPGTDAAGVVEAVGPGVTKFKKGDRVYTAQCVSGAYAEYTVANQTYVGHLHSNLNFAQGASIGIPYLTAAKAIYMRGQAKPGQTMLIHGATGSVGVAAIQIGVAMGLRVVGTASSKEGMDLVKRLGADFVYNHREEGYENKIKKEVGEIDIVIELWGNANTRKDMDLVKTDGKIMMIGSRGDVQYDPTIQLFKEVSIIGVLVFNGSPDLINELHNFLYAGQRLGWLNPVIEKTYPLGKASQAQDDVINKKGTNGKLIIDATQ